MKLRARGKAVRCSYCHGKAIGDLCDCGGTHADCLKLNGGRCPACGAEVNADRPRGPSAQLAAGAQRPAEREAPWALNLADAVTQLGSFADTEPRDCGAPRPEPDEPCPWSMTHAEWSSYRMRWSGWHPKRLCWCGPEPQKGPHANHRWRCGYLPGESEVTGCGKTIKHLGWCSQKCLDRRAHGSAPWSVAGAVAGTGGKTVVALVAAALALAALFLLGGSG